MLSPRKKERTADSGAGGAPNSALADASERIWALIDAEIDGEADRVDVGIEDRPARQQGLDPERGRGGEHGEWDSVRTSAGERP